jgi:hypothetical protein
MLCKNCKNLIKQKNGNETLLTCSLNKDMAQFKRLKKNEDYGYDLQ